MKKIRLLLLLMALGLTLSTTARAVVQDDEEPGKESEKTMPVTPRGELKHVRLFETFEDVTIPLTIGPLLELDCYFLLKAAGFPYKDSDPADGKLLFKTDLLNNAAFVDLVYEADAAAEYYIIQNAEDVLLGEEDSDEEEADEDDEDDLEEMIAFMRESGKSEKEIQDYKKLVAESRRALAEGKKMAAEAVKKGRERLRATAAATKYNGRDPKVLVAELINYAVNHTVYYGVDYFGHGIYKVEDQNGGAFNKEKRTGLMNGNGTFVSPLEKYRGYANFDPIHNLIISFYHGGGPYKLNSDGLIWGMIDYSNKVLLPFEYDMIEMSYAQYYPGYVYVEKNGRGGVASAQGEMLLPLVEGRRYHFEVADIGGPHWNDSRDIPSQICPYIIVRQGNLYGLLDKDLREVAPVKGHGISWIYEGYIFTFGAGIYDLRTWKKVTNAWLVANGIPDESTIMTPGDMERWGYHGGD